MITCPIPAVIHHAIDYRRLTAVIEALESDHAWDRPGGALQFTPTAWREDTRLPFRYAQCSQAARMVAQHRLERMARISRRWQVEPSIELLIGSWRHGLFGAMRRLKDRRPSSYMVRGEALYLDAGFNAR